MQAPESLGDVAVPAHRTVGFEDVGNLARLKFSPLHGLVVGTEQGRSMVQMLEWADLLAAKHATLPFIPSGYDVPNEAVLRVNFDLLEALLAAVLTRSPSGTLAEPQRGLGEECSDGRLSRGNSNSFAGLGLRTSNQAFAAKIKVGANARDRAKYE